MLETKLVWYTPQEKLPISDTLILWITQSDFIDVGYFSKADVSYYNKWISSYDYSRQFSDRVIKFWTYIDNPSYVIVDNY